MHTESRKLACSEGSVITKKGTKFKKQAIRASQMYICMCFNCIKSNENNVGDSSCTGAGGETVGGGRIAFFNRKFGVCIGVEGCRKRGLDFICTRIGTHERFLLFC